ncbi:hypothetical protein EW146_g7968 [Bondarzewia mesenterica]|uniref:MFS general substrate transporter n=1 Tax=Bondarzewia mesenterica TaxID=1095465 RepID=A0A4S4LI48_9AGAM|nr:hypothetical protein EW146_g7968 [Bondarzewia mesenterica]
MSACIPELHGGQSQTESRAASITGDRVGESDSDMPPANVKTHWYRSSLFQIWIVGCVFFCAPGMYNALSSLGAGGLATPWYANATAAAGYVFMAVLCITGGLLVSKIGLTKALLISSTGDIIYAGSLYLNSKNGTQWFLMLEPPSAETASCTPSKAPSSLVRILYPSFTVLTEPVAQSHRVFYPVGGAIIFGLNHSTDSSGGVSLKTYLVIIGIMCAGPFIAVNLSPPHKVQRTDGKPIIFRKTYFRPPFILPLHSQSLKEWFAIVSSPKMWLLFPLFFTSWFYGSYIGTLETQYFNVRTRSLTAFVTPFGDILGGICIGYFLDWKWLTENQRARAAFVFLMALNLGLWIWTAVITKYLQDNQPVIDWTSSSFGRTWAPFIMFEFATMATQATLYWIVSFRAFTHALLLHSSSRTDAFLGTLMFASVSKDVNTLSYITGSLRGVECAGQAVAYGIKSTNTSDWISIGLNIGLFVLSIPFAWVVIKDIGKEGVDNTIGVVVGSEQDAGDGEYVKEKAGLDVESV